MISNRTINKLVFKGAEDKRMDVVSDATGVGIVCSDSSGATYIALSPSDVYNLVEFLGSSLTKWDGDEI